MKACLALRPALAREPEEGQCAGLRRAGAGAGARRTNAGGAGRCQQHRSEIFATQLWNIACLSNFNLALRSALFSAGKVLAAESLCAFASGAQEDPGAKQAAPAQIAGVWLSRLCTRDAQSMIALGARDDYEKFSDFTALLPGASSSSLAASGGSVSAGTLLAGGSFAMSLLTKLASGVLIPLVYSIFCWRLPKARQTAAGSENPGALRMAGAAEREGLCAVFTAYLSLSRVLTGSADAMAVKAAQAAFSGMVPVVGSGILSGCVGVFAGKCGALPAARQGRSGCWRFWRWRFCAVCAAGVFIWHCGWQGQSARTGQQDACGLDFPISPCHGLHAGDCGKHALMSLVFGMFLKAVGG